jgi:hypothetical protein
MRYLALTLALCFAITSMEGATHNSSGIHQVKAKKQKTAKVHKGKRVVKHAVHKAN